MKHIRTGFHSALATAFASVLHKFNHSIKVFVKASAKWTKLIMFLLAIIQITDNFCLVALHLTFIDVRSNNFVFYVDTVL
jgi:hypothetical protein